MSIAIISLAASAPIAAIAIALRRSEERDREIARERKHTAEVVKAHVSGLRKGRAEGIEFSKSQRALIDNQWRAINEALDDLHKSRMEFHRERAERYHIREYMNALNWGARNRESA